MLCLRLKDEDIDHFFRLPRVTNMAIGTHYENIMGEVHFLLLGDQHVILYKIEFPVLIFWRKTDFGGGKKYNLVCKK